MCLQQLANEENAPLEIGWRLIPEHNGKGYAAKEAKAKAEITFTAE